MLWQAESGFRFRLAGGYLYPLVVERAVADRLRRRPGRPRAQLPQRRRAADDEEPARLRATHDVDRFVVAADAGYPSAKQLRAIGPVQRIGGVLVAPACGSAPLTTRDLGQYVADFDSAITYCLDGNFYELPAALPGGPDRRRDPGALRQGQGLTCAVPAGYRRQGLATAEQGVRPGTYPYYAP